MQPIYGITSISCGTSLSTNDVVAYMPNLGSLTVSADNSVLTQKVDIRSDREISLGGGGTAATANSAVKIIDLHGGKAVISGTYGMRYRAKLEVINAKCRVTTSNTGSQFTGSTKLHTIYWQENAQTISVNISACPLTEESLISLANGLNYGSAGTLTPSSARKTMCDNCMGTVEVVGSGDDAYERFVKNDNGTISLSTFITTNKAWTLA